MTRRFSRAQLRTLRWPRPFAVLFCAILGTLLPATYGAFHGYPRPVIHDEFSYLLGADTIAHGRLANPTPVHPEFFESPHLLLVPTYASKYPPAQAVVLAMGQTVFGHPAWGLWVSCGLFAAAVCWMLQAWISRQWALHLAIISALTLGTSSYWAQTYWGGMVAATGGALVFGAMRRTLQRPRPATSVLLGVGVIILVNSRPFEGVVASVPAAFVLLRWLLRDSRWPLRLKLQSFVAPVVAVLALGGTWTAVYNRAVTGDPLRMPHSLNYEQYFHQGPFLFSAIRPPQRASNPRIIEAHGWWRHPRFTGLRLVREVWVNIYHRAAAGIGAAFGSQITRRSAYLGVALWIPVMILSLRRSTAILLAVAIGVLAFEAAVWRLGLPYPVTMTTLILAVFGATTVVAWPRSRWVVFAWLAVALVLVAGAFVWWWNPHYMAPVAPLVLAVTGRVLQRQARSLRGTASRTLAITTLSLAFAQAIGFAATSGMAARGSASDAVQDYIDVRDALVRIGGRHLVFVQYDEDYDESRSEWVYNGADMSSAPVIFAHDLGLTRNPKLLAAFPGRQVWLLRVSSTSVRLVSVTPSVTDPSDTR